MVRIFSPSPPLARKWRNKYDEDEGQINKGHFRAEETGGRWTWQGNFELVTVSSTYGFCFDDLKQRGLCCISERSNALAAATAAESLQSCPTLCDPIYGSPPGSPIPGILQARTLEWVAMSFSNAWKWKVKVNLLSCVRLLATPWTAAHQAPPSMGFSRPEYWSGVPWPSPTGTQSFGLFRTIKTKTMFIIFFYICCI